MAISINISISRLPWYGQVGVFAALSLAIAGAFWNWYARPAQEDIAGRLAQLVTIRAEIGRGLDSARRLPEFRREVVQREAQFDRLRAKLPEDQDVANLLRRVQAMATQSNLTIKGFAPQAVAKQKLHAEWPVGLQLEGTYHDLGAFLERVSKFPRIINVGGIRIRSREGAGPSVTAECTATTFVLLDTPAKGTPAAAAAKAE
jgi:type IV pilus assembly protein PilO